MGYLLAAEADKIQDLIFRSSRLREVVGASQLLTRFCREGVEPLLEKYGGEAISKDGGSFRIVFEDAHHLAPAKQRAIEFGADLAELYRLVMNGTLSVAEPVPFKDDFQTANQKAGKALRRAKSHWLGAVAEVHTPYVAFCASCGVGLAERYGHLANEARERRGRYLCPSCQVKTQERDDKRRDLLKEFLEIVVSNKKEVDKFDWPQDADSVAVYDSRNYVAYLVADGNGMGAVFGQCDKDQLWYFSEELTAALRRSLAEPTGLLMKWAKNKDEWQVPVLPLILGGDDLFALIPAPYALDFARRFCLAYEDKLRELVKETELEVPSPTIGAAVVICKSNYPYALAHRRGEALLKEAKRLSKLLTAKSGERFSTVNFEVILGNSLAGLEAEDNTRPVRQSLRPYWVVKDKDALSDEAKEYSIKLYDLIEQRFQMKDVPNKRLAELRQHFETLPNDINFGNSNQRLEKWSKKVEPLLRRSGKAVAEQIRAALKALGRPCEPDGYQHHWRELRRNNKILSAHGMLDLLEAWDFAQDLCKSWPDDYMP